MYIIGVIFILKILKCMLKYQRKQSSITFYKGLTNNKLIIALNNAINELKNHFLYT